MTNATCYLKNTEAWCLIYSGRKRSDTQNEVFSFNSIDFLTIPAKCLNFIYKIPSTQNKTLNITMHVKLNKQNTLNKAPVLYDWTSNKKVKTRWTWNKKRRSRCTKITLYHPLIQFPLFYSEHLYKLVVFLLIIFHHMVQVEPWFR